jgi:Flp pilus assembly protein TadG
MMDAPAHRRRPRGARPARGVAIIEFVIALPIALVLIMATAEIGRALFQYNTLSQSVRDGGRYLATNAIQGSTGTIQINASTSSETRNLVVYGNTQGNGAPLLPGLQPSQITVAAATASSVSVTAAYPYDPIFFRLPMFGYGPDVQPSVILRSGIVMRAL